MSPGVQRMLRTAGVFALLGWLVGADGNCNPTDPIITLESLDAQVQVLRAELCQAYAERGEVPALTTFTPDCP